MEKLRFKTGEFEGPLDLMLHLIAKHKLKIEDIEISLLLEQYMAAIQEIKGNLEVSSEFLEMASRLVYIKTAMLLPRHEEEGTRLKAELQGQLLEYQVCQQVARELGEQAKQVIRYVREPVKLQFDTTYTLSHTLEELYNAYQDAIGRGRRRLPPPPQAFSAIVARRMVSVASRIIYILKHLYRLGRTSYVSLFEGSSDRGELVATFLAVLELVKAKRISIDDDEVIFERKQKVEETP